MTREVMLTTGSDVLAVDADVVLLFGVERLAGGFGDLDPLRAADPTGRMPTAAAVRGEIEKRSRQNHGQNKWTQ